MTDENRCAQARQTLGHRIALEIGALHRVAQVEQHLGDASHAAAADADQVNAMNAAHAIFHARPIARTRAIAGACSITRVCPIAGARAFAHACAPAAMQRSASWPAASMTRQPRAASAILSSCARSASSSL